MADVATLSVTYDRLRQSLVNEYLRQAKSLWESLTPAEWWNDAVTVGVAARSCMAEINMIAQVRRLAVSYADDTMKSMGITPSDQSVEFVYPRYGTTPWLVAMRPASTYRHDAAQYPDIRPDEWPGADDDYFEVIDQWLRDSISRLESIAETDSVVAGNMATLDRYENSKVLSYRRVVHPELSKTGTCGLCLVAADRWYSIGTLLPLHQRCRCTVAPAGSDDDPDFQLSDKDLKSLYDEAGGTDRKHLSEIRVQTITHGELGPILTTKEAKSSPRRTSSEWRKPDVSYTREQYERMLNHSREFDKRYKELQASNKDKLSFRLDGKTYVFKNTGRISQARKWQQSFQRQLEAILNR